MPTQVPRDMPTYSKEHETGEEAVDAFKRIFRGWVVREVQKNDYGIDADVDIVDADRRLTGVSFKAQIKGTNARRRGRTHSVRVKSSTLNYWRSQTVPVLVFYYVVQSGDAFYRWAHSYDPVAESKRRRGTGANDNKVTFSFTQSNRINARSLDQVVEDVAAFRSLRERVKIGPIPVEISVESDQTLRDDVRDELVGRLHELLNQSRQVFRPFDPNDLTAARLEIGRGYYRFAMPTELSSIRVSHTEGDNIIPAGLSLEVFCADTMVVAAIELALFGFSRQATTVYELLGSSSEIAKDMDARSVLATAYLDERDPDKALEQVLPGLVDDDPQIRSEAHFLVSATVDGSSGTLSTEGFSGLVDVLEMSISKDTGDGLTGRAAQLRYFSANLEKARGNLIGAISKFDDVVRLDPSYVRRGYFHRERGGCFADLDRWLEATDCYERSRACADREEDIDFVLADALLHSGRYEDSLKIAVTETQDSSHPRSRMRILAKIGKFLTTRIGVPHQFRHQLTEDSFNSLPTLSDSRTAFRVLASTDALDENVLWRLFKEVSGDDDNDSLGVFLTIAWMRPDSTFHWVASLHTAVETGMPEELLNAITDAMLYFCREEVDQYLTVLDESLGEEELKELRRVVSRRRGVAPRSLPFKHRIFDSDGNMEVLLVEQR